MTRTPCGGFARVANYEDLVERDKDHDCQGLGPHHICVRVDAVAEYMLASLNIGSIRLMTNNPRKLDELQKLGIQVSGRIPHVIPANEWNRFYLETKATRSGHHIEFDGKPHLPEQDDPVIVEA